LSDRCRSRYAEQNHDACKQLCHANERLTARNVLG
jgi:hypothetical protein